MSRFTSINYFIIPVALSSILLWTLVATPIRHGDGHEYSLTVRAIRSQLSPQITENIIIQRIDDIKTNTNIGYDVQLFENIKNVIEQNDSDLHGIFRDQKGDYYGYHFFTYSLLVALVESIMERLQLNKLGGFQVTNALIIIVTIYFVVKITASNLVQSLHFMFVVLTSGIIFYLQWTHPEVFIFCLLLICAAALLINNFYVALVSLTLASSQTISLIALFPFTIVYFAAINRHKLKTINLLRHGLVIFLCVTVALSSAIFYYVKFGVTSIITNIPYLVDYQLISVNHLISIYCDLDQGLWVGSPYLCIALTISIVSLARKYGKANEYVEIFAITIMSLLISIPMLPHSNVNSGSSVFQRYALWAAAPLAAWVGIRGDLQIGGSFAGLLRIGAVGWVAVWGGPLAAEDYLVFKPWTNILLTYMPSLYVGEPGVFFARASAGGSVRGVGSGAWDVRGDRAVGFVDARGRITKILIPPLAANPEGAQRICEGFLRPLGSGLRLADRLHPAGYGWSYVDGPFTCDGAVLNQTIDWPASEFSSGDGVIRFGEAGRPPFVWNVSGFGGGESWGRWTIGHASSVVLNEDYNEIEGAVIYANVYSKYVTSALEIICNKRTNTIEIANIVNGILNIHCGAKIDGQRQYIQFVLPGAVSPSRRFVPGDTRVLGLGVQRIVLQSRK